VRRALDTLQAAASFAAARRECVHSAAVLGVLALVPIIVVVA